MAELKLSLDGLHVFIAIPAGRPAEWETVMSLVSTVEAMRQAGIGCTPSVLVGSCFITRARDELVDRFLRSDANRLFWIDSDMSWSPGDAMRLLALSSRVDMVGAPCCRKMDQPSFTFQILPGTYRQSEIGLIEVLGVGFGFTCITRELVEEIVSTKPVIIDDKTDREQAAVFRTDIHEGHFRSEDFAFCADARALGYSIWIDPSISPGHIGTKTYRALLADHAATATKQPELVAV